MGAGGGSRLFGRDIECVCVGEGCESEREREREEERGRERVHKWHIDRETMLMLFEIGLCTETQGKRVIVCVIGTS